MIPSDQGDTEATYGDRLGLRLELERVKRYVHSQNIKASTYAFLRKVVIGPRNAGLDASKKTFQGGLDVSLATMTMRIASIELKDQRLPCHILRHECNFNP